MFDYSVFFSYHTLSALRERLENGRVERQADPFNRTMVVARMRGDGQPDARVNPVAVYVEYRENPYSHRDAWVAGRRGSLLDGCVKALERAGFTPRVIEDELLYIEDVGGKLPWS